MEVLAYIEIVYLSAFNLAVSKTIHPSTANIGRQSAMDNRMETIPFKVSAKAARLIGRENIANAEGAVGELVKNSYDADSSLCLVALLPRNEPLPKQLSSTEFQRLITEIPDAVALYSEDKDSGFFFEKSETDNALKVSCTEAYANHRDIWIIDNGCGMTADVIRSNWMVIGTDFKETHKSSDLGRRRTGAKGIGRFALDKLGESCIVASYAADSEAPDRGLVWQVDWGNFEDPAKTLDQINASMTTREASIVPMISELPSLEPVSDIVRKAVSDKQQGTLIRIMHPRDTWHETAVKQLAKYLKTLAPPTDQSKFAIYLHDDLYPNLSGYIEPTGLADFDYKMHVDVSDGVANFEITRNELRVDDIPDAVFQREEMKIERFDRSSLADKKTSHKKEFEELFPKLAEAQIEILHKIGNFEFDLYFLKRGKGGKEDEFPYRSFQPGPRRNWLDENAGIKIYRDNFFVRPYGEVGGKSFDWLGLGERVAGNPAGAGRKGWRVNPQQTAGAIHLSQEVNNAIQDQTNREGIIENPEFESLQRLVVRLIQEFEDDRSYIMSNIKKENDERLEEEQTIEEAQEAAEDVESEEGASDREKLIAEALKAQTKKLESIREDQRMMQSLATLGTVLVSFTHEISHIKNSTENRSQSLVELIEEFAPPSIFEDKQDAFNPYVLLEEWSDLDARVNQWFSFALANLRSERRRRREMKMSEYVERLEGNWRGFLDTRDISLNINGFDDVDPIVLAYEIDLDSIFNNLLVNSVEELTNPNRIGDRKIALTFSATDTEIEVIYTDNGPGIADEVKNINDVLNFNFSTKYDDEGNKRGTGIGLWILESVVVGYGGSLKLFRPSENYGFRMDINLPRRDIE